jgi:hypothetical protein
MHLVVSVRCNVARSRDAFVPRLFRRVTIGAALIRSTRIARHYFAINGSAQKRLSAKMVGCKIAEGSGVATGAFALL